MTADIIKSKLDESMMKVKLPKLLILIIMLKSIYSIYYILNNKIKCICVSALFAYLMNITFRVKIWKNDQDSFFKQ